MVRVIVCRPGETAAIEEIDDSLESMQAVVGGYIEEYQPFHDDNDPRVDDVAIYCNEEGKMNGMPPSRTVFWKSSPRESFGVSLNRDRTTLLPEKMGSSR